MFISIDARQQSIAIISQDPTEFTDTSDKTSINHILAVWRDKRKKSERRKGYAEVIKKNNKKKKN